jgi:hypothetical protein
MAKGISTLITHLRGFDTKRQGAFRETPHGILSDAIGHSGPNNVAPDIPLRSDVKVLNLMDEEEGTNGFFLTNSGPLR